MAKTEVTVITVPGLYGSDSSHWQSLWEMRFGYRRAELGNWNDPSPDAWEEALSIAVRSASDPVVLVGHSLGSVLIARYLLKQKAEVAGAFLVAPTDVEDSTMPDAAKRFSPIPRTRLPVHALVVTTGSDPYLSLHKSLELSTAWRASLCILEKGGHLGRDDGLGGWDEGHELLRTFISNLLAVQSEESDPLDVRRG